MTAHTKLRFTVTVAIFAAMLAVLSPFVIPIGPVGITLATLVLAMMAYLAHPTLAILAVLLYLALGIIGLPVFAGFVGGIAPFASPTGGFLVGYLPFVALLSLAVHKTKHRMWQILASLASLAVLYAIGSVWFAIITDATLLSTLTVTTLPFLIPDILKLIAAHYLAGVIQSRLRFL